jgi:integrator complex subunit 11
MVGYDGPIYMTHPTQAICPILLEDYRKIAVDKKGEANFFTSQMIKDCMKKVVAVHLHQTVQVRVPSHPISLFFQHCRSTRRQQWVNV